MFDRILIWTQNKADYTLSFVLATILCISVEAFPISKVPLTTIKVN